MKNNRGFTLIELMVVIAILGILVAIAVPQYSDYVLKSRLTESFTNLSDLRTRLEQFYQDNRMYADAAGVCGKDSAGTVRVAMPTTPVVRYFTYTCASTNSGQGFLLTATGQGFTYTVNETNGKATTTVPAGYTANAACWVSSKSGC
jgi:type IV pilus assembly protein PilE